MNRSRLFGVRSFVIKIKVVVRVFSGEDDVKFNRVFVWDGVIRS